MKSKYSVVLRSANNSFLKKIAIYFHGAFLLPKNENGRTHLYRVSETEGAPAAEAGKWHFLVFSLGASPSQIKKYSEKDRLLL